MAQSLQTQDFYWRFCFLHSQLKFGSQSAHETNEIERNSCAPCSEMPADLLKTQNSMAAHPFPGPRQQNVQKMRKTVQNMIRRAFCEN
jgi:hypothetical protein